MNPLHDAWSLTLLIAQHDFRPLAFAFNSESRKLQTEGRQPSFWTGVHIAVLQWSYFADVSRSLSSNHGESLIRYSASFTLLRLQKNRELGTVALSVVGKSQDAGGADHGQMATLKVTIAMLTTMFV